jgi:hypothetical protein
MIRPITTLLLMLLLLAAGGEDRKQQLLKPGGGRFTFSAWEGPPLRVYYHRPAFAGNDARIVIVLHGTNRDARRYRDEWAQLADRGGFIVVAPEFSQKNFPGSRGYNLGGMRSANGDRVPESRWAFSAIEPLFDEIRVRVQSQQASYYLYGHSAGAQFVHRFMYFKSRARVKKALAANAGWYTMPDHRVRYPYGLGGARLRSSSLKRALRHQLVILLGEKDIEVDSDVRDTRQAKLQGPHRLARGQKFFATGRARAKQMGTPFGWQMKMVLRAGHDNGQMARGAFPYIVS